MTQLIVRAATLGAGATAFNLMGNLGVRAVSKITPSYSGAILAGISSTACFILGNMTQERVVHEESDSKEEKQFLYALTVTLIGGATLPHLLSPLTKSTISLTASLGYSLLGYAGLNFAFSVIRYIETPSTPFTQSFNEFKDEHLNALKYLRS
ncbi:MAG: hypothetical protein KFB93_08290 [Simkaniaceae bacterium]|nr:MAG: hypothetical protein KFB93_08290 [Simkaniaceae bacterium]